MATNQNPQRVTIQQVTSYLQSLGFNPIQAAGIAGNLSVETGNFDPNVINGRRRGDNGTAFGMMQWRGPRQTNFMRFAKELGEDPYNWQTQLKFVKAEMVPGRYADSGSIRAMRQLQGARTVLDATKAFVHAERPQGYTVANPERSMHFRERFAAAQRGFSNSNANVATARTDWQPDQQEQFTNQGSEMDRAYGQLEDSDNPMMLSMGASGSYDSQSGYTDQGFDGTNPLGYSDFESGSPFNLTNGFSNLNNLYAYDSNSPLSTSSKRLFGI